MRDSCLALHEYIADNSDAQTELPKDGRGWQ